MAVVRVGRSRERAPRVRHDELGQIHENRTLDDQCSRATTRRIGGVVVSVVREPTHTEERVTFVDSVRAIGNARHRDIGNPRVGEGPKKLSDRSCHRLPNISRR
jgi:hypothetical protein